VFNVGPRYIINSAASPRPRLRLALARRAPQSLEALDCSRGRSANSRAGCMLVLRTKTKKKKEKEGSGYGVFCHRREWIYGGRGLRKLRVWSVAAKLSVAGSQNGGHCSGRLKRFHKNAWCRLVLPTVICLLIVDVALAPGTSVVDCGMPVDPNLRRYACRAWQVHSYRIFMMPNGAGSPNT